MSESSPKILISKEEARAVYALGEDAVTTMLLSLLEHIEKLESRVKELEGQISKNSRNSSKPPSGDGFGKKTKSLRVQSGRKTGGQPDHPGSTLEWSSQIDTVLVHKVEECQGCASSLAEYPTQDVLARQVYDIPPIVLNVTEHRAEVKICPHCGLKNQAQFPLEANSLVHYGPRLKGMMVYLMDGQLLPSERTCEVLSDIVGANVSEGTLYNTRTQCYSDLEQINNNIHSSIIAADVVNFDETGLYVNGKLWWLHVACTDGFTYYFIHSKRGQEAMNEMGILPQFGGNDLIKQLVIEGVISWAEYQCFIGSLPLRNDAICGFQVNDLTWEIIEHLIATTEQLLDYLSPQ